MGSEFDCTDALLAGCGNLPPTSRASVSDDAAPWELIDALLGDVGAGGRAIKWESGVIPVDPHCPRQVLPRNQPTPAETAILAPPKRAGNAISVHKPAGDSALSDRCAVGGSTGSLGFSALRAWCRLCCRLRCLDATHAPDGGGCDGGLLACGCVAACTRLSCAKMPPSWPERPHA